MGFEQLASQNPLTKLSMGEERNQLGLVVARAGLGKTAILVQLALGAILDGKSVLHVSIGETIDKTRQWYDDILKVVIEEQKIPNAYELVEKVAKNRMIMTFNESTFSRPRLEERMNDLVLQNIFQPNCLVVDGFDFETSDRQILEDIKDLAENMSLQSWFSAISHRGDERFSPTGVPAPCHEIDDLFDTVILLKPESDATIYLEIIRNSGESVQAGNGLQLDPTTMLVKTH